MLKKIAIGVALLLVVILGLATTKPETFTVERSTLIKAPPEKIYPLINDFHSWGAWSPWEKLDPAMKRTYGGPTSGQGATYSWDGNSDAGAGRMEITETTAPTNLALKLDFTKPMEANNRLEFSMVPEGDATRVRWVMTGPNNFLSKVMTVFVSMDGLIGKDFETGLANMKAVAEK